MTGTITLHRILTAPAERVYRAFLEPAALAKWLPPDGFTCSVHAFDPQVGGKYHMTFSNLTSGNGHSFGGTYLELLPNERIVHDDCFDDPNLPGTMVTTITFRPVFCGTELNVVQAGIPAMIPVEQCYLGWQQSLELLKRLVEPTIPG